MVYQVSVLFFKNSFTTGFSNFGVGFGFHLIHAHELDVFAVSLNFQRLSSENLNLRPTMYRKNNQLPKQSSPHFAEGLIIFLKSQLSKFLSCYDKCVTFQQIFNQQKLIKFFDFK